MFAFIPHALHICFLLKVNLAQLASCHSSWIVCWLPSQKAYQSSAQSLLHYYHRAKPESEQIIGPAAQYFIQFS